MTTIKTDLLLDEDQRLRLREILGPIRFEPASKDMRCRTRKAGVIPTRRAMLYRWHNVKTGQSLEATIPEFDDRICGGKQRGNDLNIQKYTARDGWRCDGAMHYVIQGNAVDWLTSSVRRGGYVGAQVNRRYSKIWDDWVRVVALYQSGLGIKRIRAKLGYSAPQIIEVLRECGIDTSARRNYALRGAVRSAKDKYRERYLREVSSPEGRLKRRVMSRIWSAMNSQSVNACGTFSAVGCSADELRAHIEKQFAPGMTWSNYGEWHVDHIRPCASFDLSDPEQFKACFNWSNLQPLWAAENISKSDTYAQS